MDQYEHIRQAHKLYGKSIREIARECGHSRKTVRKALNGIEPKYRRKLPVTFPKLGPYRDTIDGWLNDDLKVRRKQRHTARRVFTRLVEEYNFDGAESTVRAYVRKAKKEIGLTHTEAMIPLEHDVESGAEVDWGEADIDLNGKRTRIHIFCMRSKWSGKIFVRAYLHERQEMFFDGHMEAFDYYGGVFQTLVYDNLTTAVKTVLKGRNRVEQHSFQRFRSYYTFKSVYCTPGKGHEKGGVEGLVGYSRRNFLVPIPEVDSIKELNEALIKRCQDHDQRPKNRQSDTPIGCLFEAEKAYLLGFPKSRFANVHIHEGKVTKYQTVQVDRNHYSVPLEYVGSRVNIHVGCGHVKVFDRGQEVACHPRLFVKNQYQFDPMHYLRNLERKAGALDHALPLKAWRETWPRHYHELLRHLRNQQTHQAGSREFIQVLQLHRDYKAQSVSAAIQTCIQHGCPNYEAVKQLLQQDLETPKSYQEGVPTPGLPEISIPTPVLRDYDLLYQGGVV